MELRKIVFRAKCKDNSEWVYGSYIANYNKNDWIVQGGDFFAVDSDTMGQFTGFYDKDDKEIYEGDIFCDVFMNVRYLVYFSDIKCSLSMRRLGDIELRSEMTHRPWVGVNIYGHVLGNKFDNPELLEK